MRNKRPRPAELEPGAPVLDDPVGGAGFQHEDGEDDGEDDDDDEGSGAKKSDKKAGRRKIKIEFITDKSRRHITFSKRKAGIMKKVRPYCSYHRRRARALIFPHFLTRPCCCRLSRTRLTRRTSSPR